jgi:hypothetical protein
VFRISHHRLRAKRGTATSRQAQPLIQLSSPRE